MGINTFNPRSSASASQAHQLAADARSLDKLKREANQSPEQAARAVAQQFESVLTSMMLNSMRSTLPQDGILSGGQQLWTGMYDQQITQQFGSRGLGLTDMLTQQIKRQMSATNPNETSTQTETSAPTTELNTTNTTLENLKLSHISNAVKENTHDSGNIFETPAAFAPPAIAQAKAMRAYTTNNSFAATRSPTAHSTTQPIQNAITNNSTETTSSLNSALQTVATGIENVFTSARQRFSQTKSAFVNRLKDAAERTSQSSGIPAQFILGQAALESGWGRKEIKGPNGENSFNLFGIKANKSWTGPTVETVTTEFVNGQSIKVKQQFRSYSSYEEALQDYSQFITKNPRYAQVVAQATDLHSFATNLQKAGYATDPAYASKLMKVVKSLA
jgi:peptidoglycan hydrolase FlgJ